MSTLQGDGIDFQIHVKSHAIGELTGAYTPYSGCGSLLRVIGSEKTILFV